MPFNIQHSKFPWSALGALAAGLALAPRLALFAQFTAGVLAWRWQFDYDEGVNLHAAWLLAHATNIYAPNPPERFISAPYPPGLYLLSLPLLWTGGLGFLAPRLLVLAATLAVAALLVGLARREGAPWLGALLPGALWLCAAPVIIWAALYKQDMVALALGLAGLALLARAPDGPRSRPAALALFALAFFTKQSALAPAAAGALWLISRDPRGGLRFAAALAGTVAAVGGLLLAGSRGGFWLHDVVYQSYPWAPRFWERLTLRLAGEYWPLLLAGGAVALVLAGAWWRGRRAGDGVAPRPAVPLPVLYLGTGLLSTMVQAGYPGANNNHLLDIFPPLCWLVGAGLGRLVRPGGVRAWAALAALYALLLAQVAAFGGLENWYSAGYWPGLVRDRELAGLSAQIRATPGDIFSEDDGLLLLNGRDPVYDDPHTVAKMGDSGAWDERRLVQDLRDRRFPLILVRHEAYQWSRQSGPAFAASYQQVFAGTLDVFRPRVYPTVPQYALGCDLGRPATLRLAGVSLGPGVAATGAPPGSVLRLALYWHVLGPTPDYATFVHLIDASGKTVAARDNPHSAAGRPTSAWAPGADLTEPTDLPLPAGLAPGPYRLIGGVYSTAGGFTPVPVTCPAAPARRVGDAVDLGAVPVR